MTESPREGRPTTWIAIAAVCALAAIGLGIWAFTTKSDLDDAEATVERQNKQLALQEVGATEAEQRLRAFGRRERAAYRRVRRRLVGERAVARSLRRRVRAEAANLDQARQEVTNVQGQEQKEAAELRRARAATRLAVACSASAVDALQRFVDSSSARAGAARAVRQLEGTQQECQSASEET